MDTVIKAAAIGICTAVTALILKRDNPSGAFLLILGAGIVIIPIGISVLSPIIDFLQELASASNVSEYHLATLFKTLAISIVIHISSSACKDAGAHTIGEYIELAGGAAALYISLPLLSAVLSLLHSFFR